VIAATLNRAQDSESATVLLTPNRHGQLPTVLVDPRDSNGNTLAGLWLGDGSGGTVYEWTEPAGKLQHG
jgi:hypothetical protein